METKRLEVTAEGKKVYDIVIENSFSQLVKELSAFGIKERKLCIVTERQVASYYLEEVRSLLEKECAKLEMYIFQEGEESKNLSTVCIISLLRMNLTEKICFLHLAGVLLEISQDLQRQRILEELISCRFRPVF